MGRGHSKGSSFERDQCRVLSKWWTKGERDDVFWRSAASGAMGKMRSKSGKKTFGQCGDIQATDPIGQPLMDVCSLELKRGYGNASVGDMLDTGKNRAKQLWQTWVEQASVDHKNAGTPWWMLITKRDRRDTMVFFPWGLYEDLLDKTGSTLRRSLPRVQLVFMGAEKKRLKIYGTQFNGFLEHVSPDNIKDLRNVYKPEK